MQELLELATEAGRRLRERRQTIAVSESSTGGLISAALLSVPGASSYFLGGSVVYTQLARELLMDIPDDEMKGMRSASEPYARLLADTLISRFQSTWALAETGAAGPAGNRYGDDAGHCCLAVAGVSNHSLVIETGDNDRFNNMQRFSQEAIRLLLKQLESSASD